MWTLQEDFEKLGLKKSVKLQEIKLGGYAHGLSSIQLGFSDRIQSPLFQTSRKDSTVTHFIDQKKQITGIKIKVNKSQYLN